MSKPSILPADTYMVMNNTVMNDIDRQVLTMLYQPIVGHLPIGLYFTLWSDLDKTEIMSLEFTHHHLMNRMQLKLEDIIKAREKLEAIGLIKTYLKKDNNNHYVYLLYSPLSAHEFLNNPILNVILYSNVGSNEYSKIVNYFKLPKINLNEFEDITNSFSDVYKTVPKDEIEQTNDDIRNRKIVNLSLEETIDFNLIISSIPNSIMNNKAFDSKTRDIINKLSFLYGIDSLHMINIIRSSINEKGYIDKIRLRTLCRNYYQFENNNRLPNLIYRQQPETLRKEDKDDSKRAKIIHSFETLSPYEFLIGRYNGANPTSRDVKLVESLMVEQELTPGVVNVLIDYVLMVNANKLNKNFIETIAGQWKRINIKTVEEAMKQAEKEHKKYKGKISSNYTKDKKEEKLPDWFNKEIKEEVLSSEEEDKIKNMLKEFS
jgi:replication initiation and membrane attachment protein